MVKRMLIEATHPEETRVVVLDGTRLEEFDVETSTKKQIKGNIYLAKVVRVEPSLQAAFVDYGGNRHGFLAFSEIHPDYYQIPVADRERLMAEVQRHEEEEERREQRRRESRQSRGRSPARVEPHEQDGVSTDHGDSATSEASGHDHSLDHDHAHDHSHEHEHDHAHEGGHDHDVGHDHDAEHDHEHGDAIPLAFIPPAITSTATDDDSADDDQESHGESDSVEPEPAEAGESNVQEIHSASLPDVPTEVGGDDARPHPDDAADEPSFANVTALEEGSAPAPTTVETVGGDEEEEAAEEKQRRRFVASRHYKIQEVIKRRQIMLIQVVKEERGNKGAALTTFLSLAGRYCVLMPNSPRGGGVSRKITSAQDRRRLKTILGDLELPKNMAVILRTAGAERNKTEIKRDYEYLQRTWNNIREVTMTSRAPALIHEEASLIKRAIRDIYSRDIEEVWVEGEEGYKIGKDFMKMLTPSHAKKVQRYKDDIIPLFHRYQVESQMEAINSPTVQLRSGGSIVFAQTEALVAIDVNSGRATKERHIEETAYKTNMEAADEIARQLRLRDLAGLVVIDFIDMEDSRNNHAVERRLKEALKADRARIQVGRISHFGLLELSRQRLRPSLIEANFRVCAHCAGSGMVRSTESAAVYSLRMLEEEGGRQRSSEVTITVHPDVALYLLNYKRDSLASIESRYRIKIFVLGDATLVPPNIRLDRVKAVRGAADEETPHRDIAPREIERDRPVPAEVDESDEEEPDEAERTTASEPRNQEPRQSDPRAPRDENGGRKRRRRRRRRGGEFRNGEGAQSGQGVAADSPKSPEGGDDISASQGAGWSEVSETNQGSGSDEHTQASGDGGENRPDQGGRDEARRGRRRGRRGGRKRRRGGEHGGEQGQNPAVGLHNGDHVASSSSWEAETVPSESDKPPRAENEPVAYVAATAQLSEQAGSDDTSNGTASRPSRFFRALKEGAKSWGRGGAPDGAGEAVAEPAPPPPVQPAPTEPQPAPDPGPSQPTRRGWWSQDAKE